MRHVSPQFQPAKPYVFLIQGKDRRKGTTVSQRVAASHDHDARQRAETMGIEVQSVTLEGESLQGRRWKNRPASPLWAYFWTILICMPLSCLFVWAFSQNREEATARARALPPDSRGPDWEAALEFARSTIPPGRDGVGWFITGSGSSDIQFDASTSEYSIAVHTYGHGKNPLTGSASDVLRGRLIVRGAGANWTFVKLDPFAW